MSFRAFVGDRELQLNRPREKRVLSPFELGFHAAAVDQSQDANPFPVVSTVGEEWDQGWELFLKRKKRLHWWDPMLSKPGTSDEKAGITFICFGQDPDGYFLLKPCRYRWVRLEGGIWTAYDRSNIRVIECAHFPMKSPEQVNVMRPDFDWNHPDL